jgi:hypothetical protein
MATPTTIEAAVRRLESRGVRRIAVVRMFISGESFVEPTEYILGLRTVLPADPHATHAMAVEAPHSPARAQDAHAAHAGESHSHVAQVSSTDARPAGECPAHAQPQAAGTSDHHMEPPRRVHTGARIVMSRGGVADSPLVDQILVDRVRALSRQPVTESVLVLGHGPGDDAENQRWLAAMQSRCRNIRQIGPFRRVQCETLREDWPDKRAAAEQRIRRFVEEGQRDGGRVIVIPFRIAGFGPYREVLDGLTYVADERGFCPHPHMTRWLRETAAELLAGR